MDTLHAEIVQLETSIAQLTEDNSDLTKAVAELDATMAKATTLRQEENEKHEQTISNSSEAQTAVAHTLTVLKEFYASLHILFGLQRLIRSSCASATIPGWWYRSTCAAKHFDHSGHGGPGYWPSVLPLALQAFHAAHTLVTAVVGIRNNTHFGMLQD